VSRGSAAAAGAEVAVAAFVVFEKKMLMPVVTINRKRSESARAWAFETQERTTSAGPATIVIAGNRHWLA